MEEAREVLSHVLADDTLANVPTLVLGNKIDREHAASEEELRHALGLVTSGKGGGDLHPNERPQAACTALSWSEEHGVVMKFRASTVYNEFIAVPSCQCMVRRAGLAPIAVFCFLGQSNCSCVALSNASDSVTVSAQLNVTSLCSKCGGVMPAAPFLTPPLCRFQVAVPVRCVKQREGLRKAMRH